MTVDVGGAAGGGAPDALVNDPDALADDPTRWLTTRRAG